MRRLLAALPLSLLLALATSVTLHADDAGGQGGDRGDTTDLADTARSDDGRSLSPAEALKEATFVMMEDLIEISEEIESVADVRKARPEIAAAMDKIVVLTEEMIADAASLTPEDLDELRNVETDMNNDPRYKKLSRRATKVQADLTRRSPEAAAEFEKVTQEEGMKMAQAMMNAMQETMSRQLEEMGEDDDLYATPPDSEESLQMSTLDDEYDAQASGSEQRGSPATRLKEATYAMMEKLVEISEEIESVADVREARPEIAAAMQKIVVLTEGMVADAASLTAEDQAALQSMQSEMQNDPRFKELNERAKKAQADLTERSPEAAAAFEKITQKEGIKMAQAMLTAMQEIMSQSMLAEEETPSPATRLKEATYTMMEELIEISEHIKSVKDADKARPRIAAAMRKLVVLTEEMIADAASLTSEDQEELQNMQEDMQDDPRFLELSRRAEDAQEKMALISPEAEVRFQEIVQDEGMKMAEAMQKAMEEVMEEIMEEMDEEYESEEI